MVTARRDYAKAVQGQTTFKKLRIKGVKFLKKLWCCVGGRV